MEREQETLTDNFADNVLKEVSDNQPIKEQLTLEMKAKPIVGDDESFANLASRIVDEVVTNRSGKSLAKQVLEQAGISQNNEVAEPKISNGHLRHVGRRARKLSRKQNDSQALRIRRVKRNVRGPPPNLRRMGAPKTTRNRPALGMEDELSRSARDSNNRRGKAKKKRRLFGR